MHLNLNKNTYSNDAQFYDLDPREILKADISFYLQHASKIKEKIKEDILERDILELACGTGRITIPLAEAGHNVWGLEFSETMLEQFKKKMKGLPKKTAAKIHLVQGDMSDFQISQGFSFPLVILPCRSFQLLYDEEKEIACLKNVYDHLSGNGYFIIDIGNFVPNKEKEDQWVSDEEFFDWENSDPKTGFKIHRTHIRKEIDTVKQIIYPQKTYCITMTGGVTEKVVKRSPWKYFFENQIRNLLVTNGFKIIEEMGYYDGRPITETNPEFIFICQKEKSC